MARRRVGVLEDIKAVGVVPIAVAVDWGQIVRLREVTKIIPEGAKGTVYHCRMWDGNEMVLRRAYETGYWFWEM